MTVFGATGDARTFDYGPGDVGIVPRNMGHFVENVGTEEVEMLEVFRAGEFRDFSLFQWYVFVFSLCLRMFEVVGGLFEGLGWNNMLTIWGQDGRDAAADGGRHVVCGG